MADLKCHDVLENVSEGVSFSALHTISHSVSLNLILKEAACVPLTSGTPETRGFDGVELDGTL
jgi:hypothetical protein